MGFILMYDICNEESFNAVQDWATQIKTHSWDNAQVILVGNKCDMDDERVVPADKGKQLADQLGRSMRQLGKLLWELSDPPSTRVRRSREINRMETP
ncbi:RAB3B protein, partial [Atractosteus spatula]|nr:RAB3B protein [Atractosteus spatula]